MKLIFFQIFALSISFPDFAQGPGWTGVVTITQLVDTANGGVNVRVKPELTGCVSQSGYGAPYASIWPTHPGLKNLKASLMLAYATGKPVDIYLSDDKCNVAELRW